MSSAVTLHLAGNLINGPLVLGVGKNRKKFMQEKVTENNCAKKKSSRRFLHIFCSTVNGQLFELTDGVAMGFPLGPFMAHIFYV